MPSELKRYSGSFRLLWGTSGRRVQLLLLVIGIISIALILAQAQTPDIQFDADAPGVGLLGQRFMIAVPITNDGTLDAANVLVTGATWGTAPLLSPTTFPVGLGVIAAGDRFVFQADFDATGLAQNTVYVLTVNGTYQVNEVTFSFTLTLNIGLPPASPGSGTTKIAMVPAQTVSGGPFPPLPPNGPDVEPAPPVPAGPFVPGTPSQQTMSVQVSEGATPAVEPRSGPAVVINANDGFGNLISNGPAGDPGEPSGASGGGVVFVSFNWGAAFSTTGGSPFTMLDPSTMISTDDPYKFCCDQHVQYVPKIKRFIWLQQLNFNGKCCGPGGYRLAVASPGDIKKYNGQIAAWKIYKFTDETFELAYGTQFDFPSLSVGKNHLYISWDNNCPSKPPIAGCIVGRQVVRIALSAIEAGADPLPVRYTSNAGTSGGCAPGGSCLAWATFLTQDTGDEVFWAGHNGTSALRVFSWAESSNHYFWRDVPLKSSYISDPDGCVKKDGTTLCKNQNGHIGSVAPVPVLGGETTPPVQDWLFRNADDDIVGATRQGSDIWFAWNAAPNPNLNLPQHYIEMVAIDTLANFTAVQQTQIWNAAYAYGLPSLSTNTCGEIGFSLAYGGGSYFPNHAVGFVGDYTVYPTTSGSVTGSEYGDYVTIRRNYTSDPHGAFFDAFGYALTKASGSGFVLSGDQVNIDVRHVVFGRPGGCAQ